MPKRKIQPAPKQLDSFTRKQLKEAMDEFFREAIRPIVKVIVADAVIICDPHTPCALQIMKGIGE